LWTDGPDARWVLGTRGGSLQPQFVAQVAARSIFGDEALAAAQTAPRWAIADFGPHSPPQLSVEPGVPATIVDGLTIRGHRLSHLSEPQPGWGPLSIIGLELDRRLAAADPRVDTTAALVF
jgi:gamma-glutamyltranspeptidase